MFLGYGRELAWGTTCVFGGLVSKTTDASGAPYPPNDCGSYSSTGIYSPHLPYTAPGQVVPNFRGAHPGMVMFLMCDGSVRPIKTTINMAAYIGLSTIAGGEVLSADQF
jgi:prepilin-type processing-associated H-X9-DG protein